MPRRDTRPRSIRDATNPSYFPIRRPALGIAPFCGLVLAAIVGVIASVLLGSCAASVLR